MGRLFWKFFLLIALAQIGVVVAIGAVVWARDRANRDATVQLEVGPAAEFVVASAEATLRHGGSAALQSLLASRNRPVIYAVDDANHEILNRRVPRYLSVQAAHMAMNNPSSLAVRRVPVANNHFYLLFVPAMHRTGSRIGQSPVRAFVPESPPLPIAPTIGLLLGSLLCAALLARYVSKPIHDLRIAFDNAARGDLSLRIGSRMTQRTDELANLGRDFDRMATQLQALLDNQRRLLHHVSHELRSPLARLQIAAGLARYHPDTVATSLDRIDRECARLDTLVGEILTLSKFEAGVVEPLTEQVDLTKLVTDIVMDARFEARTANHTIVLANDDHVVVAGRSELLHRAIENVIRNALKYSLPGTRICVSMAIELAADGTRYVRLTVDDAGNGVSEAELTTIFLPFSRGAASTPIQGHGLGLTIAKHVIEAHGGSIRAMNLPSGLRVEMDLPAISHV